MKLYIGGGCNEHGRNCFYLETGDNAIMVDCGQMGGDRMEPPALSREQIEKTTFLFLTHSHADHVGALPWLYGNGFKGQVVLTDKTYEQMKEKPETKYIFDKSRAGETIPLTPDLSFEFGRSGHCEGAVWYLLHINGKNLFFSGDYCEHSAAYPCDLVRMKKAEFAMIDCAYGNDQNDSEENRSSFLSYISALLKTGKSIVFPSPVNGRGADFLGLLQQFEDIKVVAEEKLIRQVNGGDLFWNYKMYVSDGRRLVRFDGEILPEQAVYIICDPQLKKKANQELVKQMVDLGNLCVFTGHVDSGTEAEKLLAENRAVSRRYYVHQNFKDAKKITALNEFAQVGLNHSGKRIDAGAEGGLYRPLQAGDWILV